MRPFIDFALELVVLVAWFAAAYLALRGVNWIWNRTTR